jgi:hypothetical protein
MPRLSLRLHLAGLAALSGDVRSTPDFVEEVGRYSRWISPAIRRIAIASR